MGLLKRLAHSNVCADKKTTPLLCSDAQISARRDEQLILQQKKIRLSSEIALNQKELREMQGAIKDMRTEMSRVNQLILKQLSKRETLERETQSLSEEFDTRMSEHEKLERQIDETVQVRLPERVGNAGSRVAVR